MIRQNDWSQLSRSASDVSTDVLVSVIIPAHCTQEMLDLCIAALQEQTLRSDQLEVIVVDHRSQPPLQLPAGLPQAPRFFLHRLDTGSGPGAARAYGATQASGEVFVFIDVDILSSSDMVRQYARMPSHDPSVVSLGFREFLNPDEADTNDVLQAIRDHALLDYASNRPAVEGQEWIDAFLSRADGGLMWRDDLWVVVVGAGLGVSRYLYNLAGGFRDFPVHGIEDTEFGWRLFQAGAVIAPNRDAIGVHWGLRSISIARAEIMRLREGFLSNLIAHNRHRVPALGRSWAVSKLLAQVVCRPESTAEELVRTCHDLLRSSEDDVVIEVFGAQELRDRALAHSWLDSEPRVIFSDAPAAGVPESVPFVLRTFAGLRYSEGTLTAMIRELDDSKAGLLCAVAGSDAVSAELWRTRVLARALFFPGNSRNLREAMRATADEKWVPGDRVGLSYVAGASDAVKKAGRWVLENG